MDERRGWKGAPAKRFSQLRDISSTCLFARVYSRRQSPGAHTMLIKQARLPLRRPRVFQPP